MSKTLILFGNGLGRALDFSFFDLRTAFSSVWNGDLLSEKEKELISSVLPAASSPEDLAAETELFEAQVAMNAIEQLQRSVPSEILSRWLSSDALELRQAIFNLNSHVARYFHSYNRSIPERFGRPLVKYVRDNNPHIITLNYDALLYSLFCKKHKFGRLKPYRPCDDFRGALIDGFTDKDGFSSLNFTHITETSLGYFLHLHGTPVFADGYFDIAGETILRPTKLRREEMRTNKSSGKHIVLNHGKMKPAIIASSPILSLYWERFQEAVLKSQRIVLFGYSGDDHHLNDAIRSLGHGASKTVIEWKNPTQNQRERKSLWDRKLGNDTRVLRLDDVTSFTNWDNLELDTK